MKILVSILLIYTGASITFAQAQPQSESQDEVEVIKFSWSKQRIGWERDPFGGPLETFDEMRSRVRNEKRIDDAKRGGGTTAADQIKREAKADAANLARQREKAPARYFFVYKIKLKNNGTAAITAIDWDYIFFQRNSKNELGRHQFTSEERIGPGKSKELTVIIASPPTQTISVTSLNRDDERERLSEKVVLVRFKFADGRVWQNPAGT